MNKQVNKILNNSWLWLGMYGLILVVLNISENWRLIWLLVGLLMGWWFEWLDRWVYVLYTYPHEQLSIQVRFLLKDQRYFEAMKMIRQRGGEQIKLITKSQLFMLFWMPMAFFVITSTDSWVGKGMMLGLGLKIAFEAFYWRNRVDLLIKRMLWQYMRPMSEIELRWMLLIFGVVFVWMTVLA